MEDEDSRPLLLISAQYEDTQRDSSPKIKGFYDQYESLDSNQEPSMDLGSMDSKAATSPISPPNGRVYTPPMVEDSPPAPQIEKYITCQICQTTISLKSFKARVVKCPRCHEGNPIKDPPPGKKYIRCACNCLLVCNATARAVICPRDGCNHRTQLINPPHTPKLVKNTDKTPSANCPKCLFTIKLTLPRKQYIRCAQCNMRITTLSKSERSLLLLRYIGFFVILALLLITGILILELVPGKVWEPMLFCGLAFGVGFPCLIYRFLPLCNSTSYR